MAATINFNNHLTGVFNFEDDLRDAINEQGITDIDELAALSISDIDDLQSTIKRPGGTIDGPNPGQRIPNPGANMPLAKKKLLVQLGYYRRHCTRTSTAFAYNAATTARMREMQSLMEQEKNRRDEHSSLELPKLKDEKKARKVLDDLRDYLARELGISGVPLSYVLRDDPAPLANQNYAPDGSEVWQEMVDQAPHTGLAFRADNIRVFGYIKEMLRDTIGEPWITAFESSRNGRGAYESLIARYLGTRQSSSIAEGALDSLKTKFYTGRTSRFSFSMLVDAHKRCHDDVARHDVDGPLSNVRKVRYLCDAVRDSRLRATCDYIRIDAALSQDFDSAAAVLQEAAQHYGFSSQSEGRNVGSMSGRVPRGGRGRGRGGRGGRGGRDFRGGRGRGRGGRGRSGFIAPERWNALQDERRQLLADFDQRLENERRNASAAASMPPPPPIAPAAPPAPAPHAPNPPPAGRSASSMSRRFERT